LEDAGNIRILSMCQQNATNEKTIDILSYGAYNMNYFSSAIFQFFETNWMIIKNDLYN